MSWFRLDATSGVVVCVSLLALTAVLRALMARTAPGRPRRWVGFVAAAAFEVGLVSGLFALWQLANRATHTHQAGGLAHGRAVWHAERWLHLPSETSLQHLILGHPDVVRAANYYYATAHLTGMFVFLVWLWLRHRDRYPQWRNIVVAFTGMSLLVEMVPVAPPRLIGGTGLEDTALAYGQSVYQIVGSNLADQYAAFPSIHVGWALIIGIACLRCSTSRWRWIGPGHAVVTFLVVVATANHYWLDGVAAAVVLAVAWALDHGGRLLTTRLRAARALRAEPDLRSSSRTAPSACSDEPADPSSSSRSDASAPATGHR